VTIYDPSHDVYGTIPGAPNRTVLNHTTDKSTSGDINSFTGQCVGYALGVLHFHCGRTSIPVAANPGPWAYTQAAASAIHDLKAWYQALGVPGITVNEVCDAKAYELLDVSLLYN
jgi:hypothetical protein